MKLEKTTVGLKLAIAPEKHMAQSPDQARDSVADQQELELWQEEIDPSFLEWLKVNDPDNILSMCMAKLERSSPQDLFQDHPEPIYVAHKQGKFGLSYDAVPAIALFKEFNKEWGINLYSIYMYTYIDYIEIIYCICMIRRSDTIRYDPIRSDTIHYALYT